MQAVAREMNLAETAYLRPADTGFELRWFTPTVEVDLCGHAENRESEHRGMPAVSGLFWPPLATLGRSPGGP